MALGVRGSLLLDVARQDWQCEEIITFLNMISRYAAISRASQQARSEKRGLEYATKHSAAYCIRCMHCHRGLSDCPTVAERESATTELTCNIPYILNIVEISPSLNDKSTIRALYCMTQRGIHLALTTPQAILPGDQRPQSPPQSRHHRAESRVTERASCTTGRNSRTGSPNPSPSPATRRSAPLHHH